MDLFEFDSYKIYVQRRIEALPKRGYGQLKKLAHYLNVSTTFVSQVFQNNKSLNLEQGSQVAEFFGLSDLETEFFLKLILVERSGSKKLTQILENEKRKIRAQAQQVSSRLMVKKILSDEDKAQFYSDWHFAAIGLLIGIEGFQEIETISRHLNLPRKTVGDALNFLLKSGLLIKDGERLKVGPSRTHLEPDSPLIRSHHTNWRLKALEHINRPDLDKLHYSAPMTVGRADVAAIKNVLLKAIQDVGKIVDPAPNEELVCLNIDWFKINPREQG